MHDVSISIPGDIDPFERGDRFEEPIMDALADAEIEFEYRGGGSALGEVDGGMAVTGCDCFFGVADLKRGVEIIARVLKDAGAPPDTTIRIDHPQETIFRLGDLS
jgi:hypothetical protein